MTQHKVLHCKWTCVNTTLRNAQKITKKKGAEMTSAFCVHVFTVYLTYLGGVQVYDIFIFMNALISTAFPPS